MATMPAQATCCQCKREFPVKAVMSLPGGNIPLFVVLSEVSSVEEAIALATCQVCLNKEGPSDRGLHAILVSLGCKDVQMPGPLMDQRALPGNRKPAGLSMSGVRVTLPRIPEKPSLPFRRPAPPREPSLNEEPRFPKILEKPVVHEHEPKPEPLRAPLVEAAQLRELRKRVRAANAIKFLELVEELRTGLERIRSMAATEDMDGAVDGWFTKLGEALRLDPDQRGKAKLLMYLKTTEEELESLRLVFWATHSIVPKKGSGDGGEGEDGDTYEARPHVPRSLAIGIKLEEVEENPFPDGRRPRHFDKKGEGRQATLHPVIVVRAKSELPRVPNKPLGEPEDPPTKIVYPNGGLYGVAFTVQGSRRIPPKDRSWSCAQMTLAVWSLDHENTVVTCNGVLVNLCDLMCSYIEPYVLPQSEESAQVVQIESSDAADTETQPHTEA